MQEEAIVVLQPATWIVAEIEVGRVVEIVGAIEAVRHRPELRIGVEPVAEIAEAIAVERAVGIA
jgi:hypothetical protein